MNNSKKHHSDAVSLTRQEANDIFDIANACLAAMDMTPYSDAMMFWQRDSTGKPQVVIMPIRIARNMLFD